MDENELRQTIEELLKGSIQKQLLIPRLSRAFDGTTKPVNQNYDTPLPAPKLVTSNLYNSTEVYFETNFDDGDVNLVVDFGDADYWYFVDQGRRPSERYPNIQDIKNWVIQKPALNYPDLSIDQRTFLVARSIKEYGSYGINFIQSAYEEVSRDLEDLFGNYAVEYLRKIVERDIIVNWNKEYKYDTQAMSFNLKLEIV